MKRILKYKATACRMINDEITCALQEMFDQRYKKVSFTANGTTAMFNEHDNVKSARRKFDRARGGN